MNKEETKDYMSMLASNKIHLEDVPHDLRTHELCMIAVRANGWNFFDVPYRCQTVEMVDLVFQEFRAPHIFENLCPKLKSYVFSKFVSDKGMDQIMADLESYYMGCYEVI